MDNHVKKLTGLLSLKKGGKREPNSLERKQFEASWTALVKESGFCTEAESFLYDGYTYCGAEPFYAYMKNAESSVDTLNKLYRGKKYRETCVNTSSILIHLFALSLNDSNRDIRVIVSLIQHIPTALKTKEDKLYGQAGRAFKKYLFDKLKPNITYPDIPEMMEAGLREVSIRNFSNVLGEIIEKMDCSKFNKRCQENIHSVEAWLSPLDSSKPEISLTTDSPSEAGDVTKKAEISIGTSAEAGTDEIPVMQESPETPDSAQSEETPKADPVAASSEVDQEKAPENVPESEVLQAELDHLKTERAALEQSLHEAGVQLRELQGIRESLEAEIAKLNRTLADREATITSLREQVKACESEIATLKNSVTAADKKASDLAADVSQRDGLIEMLRRDRSRQSDEAMKRLASRLRYLYMDYIDAKSLEMSEDLGENMRDQFGEVFKILISAGITF